MRAAKTVNKRRKSRQPRVVYREGSWLRDKDILGAWGFRTISGALLGVIVWLLVRGQSDIDTLKAEVPVLSNTVAALTEQLKGEQNEIGKLWAQVFATAINQAKGKK